MKTTTLFFVSILLFAGVAGVVFANANTTIDTPLEEKTQKGEIITVPTLAPVPSFTKEVLLSPAEMQRCTELGTSCGYQLGCCVWNWEEDPPTYSCGCVLSKK